MTRSAVQICLTAPNKKASLLRCFLIFCGSWYLNCRPPRRRRKAPLEGSWHGAAMTERCVQRDLCTLRLFVWKNGKKEDPADRRASAFTDIIFFIAEDQIVHIGDTMLHERTTFPGKYSEAFVSNPRKKDCIVFYAVLSFLEMLFCGSFKLKDQSRVSMTQYKPAHTIVLLQFGFGGKMKWIKPAAPSTPKATGKRKESFGVTPVCCMSLWKLRKKFST